MKKKRKNGNPMVQLVEEELLICPICDKKLVNETVPHINDLGKYCLRCHVYFYYGKTDQKTKEHLTLLSPNAINSFRKAYIRVSKQPKMTYHISREPATENNIGRKGYCIKCGEPVYRDEKYCFECFKAQRSE